MMNENEDLEIEKTRYNHIIGRLQALETHVINLILPLQNLTRMLNNMYELREMINIFKEPLKVDSRALSAELNSLQKTVQEATISDLGRHLGELKFIAQKLNKVEENVAIMKRDGVQLKSQNIMMKLKKKLLSFTK